MSATNLPPQEMAKQIRSHLKTATQHLDGAGQAFNDKGRGQFTDLLEALDHLELARARIVQTINWTVRLSVASDASWKQIGDALGVTKQAAQQRFGSTLVDRKLPGV